MDFSGDDLLIELVGDLLKNGQNATIIARATSMMPLIRPGDRLTLSPAAGVQKGEIVAYRTPLPGGNEGIVVHRVIGLLPDRRLLLKGDACPVADLPIEPGRVLGRLTAVIPAEARVGLGAASRILLHRDSRFLRILLRFHEFRFRWLLGELPLTFLPVSHGRLLREQALIALASGHAQALEFFEEEDDPLRLDEGEGDLLPPILGVLQQAGVVDLSLLPPETEMTELRVLERVQGVQQALGWVESALQVAGQDVLLMHGVAFGLTVYPDPHCRPVDRLTVLGRPGAFSATLDAFLAAGAALADAACGLRRSVMEAGRVVLRLPEPNWPLLVLEAESGPAGRFSYPSATLWSTAVQAEGPRIYLPSPEGLLLSSVPHMANALPHLRLIWAVDLSLAAGADPDWDRVVRDAAGSGLALPAAILLRWLEDHAPGVLPPSVTARLTEHADRHAALRERLWLWRVLELSPDRSPATAALHEVARPGGARFPVDVSARDR